MSAPEGTDLRGEALEVPAYVGGKERTMALEQVDQVIDIRGKICPYTLIDTREALKGMTAGQVLEVVCDYEPAATTTIPNFCEKKGYPLAVSQAGGEWRLRIRRTD